MQQQRNYLYNDSLIREGPQRIGEETDEEYCRHTVRAVPTAAQQFLHIRKRDPGHAK